MTLFEKVQQCVTENQLIKSRYPHVSHVSFKLQATEDEFDAYVGQSISFAKNEQRTFGNFTPNGNLDVTIFAYFEAQPSKEELDELYNDNTEDPDRRYHR